VPSPGVRNEGARHGSAPLAVPLRSMGAPDVNARMSRTSKRTQTQEALSQKRGHDHRSCPRLRGILKLSNAQSRACLAMAPAAERGGQDLPSASGIIEARAVATGVSRLLLPWYRHSGRRGATCDPHVSLRRGTAARHLELACEISMLRTTHEPSSFRCHG
jgi:hypothetical protein